MQFVKILILNFQSVKNVSQISEQNPLRPWHQIRLHEQGLLVVCKSAERIEPLPDLVLDKLFRAVYAESPCRMLLLSRRISLTIMRSGWLSHARKLTYRLSLSKKTHTSVFSLATCPPLGSIWM